MSKVKLDFEIDIDELRSKIEDALNLNDNSEVFRSLAEVYAAKRAVDQLADLAKSVEVELKSAIKSRATQLYGPTWEAIKGDGYKITRSGTGAVYNVVNPDEVDPLFVQVKFSANTEAVEEFIKAESKLPPGIDRNPTRGEQIRITVDTDVDG